MYQGNLAVLYEGTGDLLLYQQLAARLQVPLKQTGDHLNESFFLTWRDDCLKLLDQDLLKKGGLTVEIAARQGEGKSFPIAKQGALAQAIGRKTKTVLDATTGWGQDSLCLFRMGYQLTCLERSPIMTELLQDGLQRLAQEPWIKKLHLTVPTLHSVNAIDYLSHLDNAPDCIYLDPMFPPKRKKSALAKKSLLILRDLLGDDLDKEQLFQAALQTTAKRVVVKSPDDAPALGKPNESFGSKLLRYDVYLKR